MFTIADHSTSGKRVLLRVMLLAAAERAAAVLLILCLLGTVWLHGVNTYIKASAEGSIITADEAAGLDCDCVLVLGCGVNDDGKPRLLLRDRLDCGIALYQTGAGRKLLMSGDHGRVGYDEVNAMKDCAMEAGVLSEDVFMDHAGFSTYESMYRAREVFKVESVVIVTQRYHLYRALYIADALGLRAYGVACDPGEYHGQIWLDAREVLARNKDLFYCLLKPLPTFLGEIIPISGSGDLTND